MIVNLGRTGYADAYAAQRELLAKRALGEVSDSIILTEHNSVYTIGRGGSESNILADRRYLSSLGIDVLRVDRGGDVTYHGPGQAVIYPVIDLNVRCSDLHRYMRDLESAVILFLGTYGIDSGRVAGMTGVWAQGMKVASIGVGARGWITYHGVGVNIDTDLRFFDHIYPCGMKGVRMASLSGLAGRHISMEEAFDVLTGSFCTIFGLAGAGGRQAVLKETVHNYGGMA